MNFTEEFLSAYKGLVFQIRAEGVSLSDRRVVKMLKLFAASAYLDGRTQPDASDFFVLKHIWNNEDQAAILEAIVQPVLEALFREHPDARRVGALGVGVEALAGEIDRIRQVLTGGARARRRAALQPAQGAQRDQDGARRAQRSARPRARGAGRPAPRGRVPQRPLRADLESPGFRRPAKPATTVGMKRFTPLLASLVPFLVLAAPAAAAPPLPNVDAYLAARPSLVALVPGPLPPAAVTGKDERRGVPTFLWAIRGAAPPAQREPHPRGGGAGSPRGARVALRAHGGGALHGGGHARPRPGPRRRHRGPAPARRAGSRSSAPT